MYFTEEGKTWWQRSDGSIVREHDLEFQGMRFEHRRCPFCQRITSIHALHWLRHMDKCADPKFTKGQLLELRYKPLSDLLDQHESRFYGRE